MPKIDNEVKRRWINILRWLAVLPVHLFTPSIVYFVTDLYWQTSISSRFTIEQGSFWYVLNQDMVARLAAFYVAVQVAPSYKKVVFIVLFIFWIVFCVFFCGFAIAHGKSWNVIWPFVIQAGALLIMMRFLNFEKKRYIKV